MRTPPLSLSAVICLLLGLLGCGTATTPALGSKPDPNPVDVTNPTNTHPVGIDADGDGSRADIDCDEANAAIHPGAADITGNTLDEDCSGSAADVDGDGFDAEAAGGTDADDSDTSIHPGAQEICGDAKDNDQNGSVDDGCNPDADLDGDGESPNQGDCNDSDAAVSTTATEISGNAIDENCDGIRADQDGDGHTATANGGNDCDDLHSTALPNGTESADNGIDEDCSGLDATLMTFTRFKAEILSSATGYGCDDSACHGSASPPEGLSLTAANAYSLIYNVASGELPTMKRVAPGDPDSSYLLHKLKGTQGEVGGSGLRMPRGGSFYLTAKQIIEVTNWIAHGAQNN